MRTLIVSSLVLAWLSSSAAAEIYKCKGANGDVRFTSDASQCPKAAPHAPNASAMQRADKAEAPLVSARSGAIAKPKRPPAKAADAAADSEAVWKKKKRDAVTKQRDLEMQVEYLKRAVNWCNRGNTLWTEDNETGLREDVSCSDVDEKYADMKRQKEQADHTLAEGLEEECRRAGCLPGWLR